MQNNNELILHFETTANNRLFQSLKDGVTNCLSNRQVAVIQTIYHNVLSILDQEEVDIEPK